MRDRVWHFVASALLVGACGGHGLSKPDGAAGRAAAGQGGGAGAGGATDAATSDATDAPVAISCADAGGGFCNDNPAVSALWGTCGADGLCHCMAGFAINPATGKCRFVPADASTDAPDGADLAAPLPAWRSGTRLRARLLETATAGEAIFQGVADKDLGGDCYFVKASDGAVRCMPGSSNPFYSDMGCSTPIAPVAAGCTLPPYISRIDACLSSGLKVGPKVAPAKIFALNPTGGCVEGPAPGDLDFYAVTPVAVTTFVAATELRDPRGGGLEMRYWASDDGGLLPIGAWDVARGASCVQGAGAFADICAPAVVAHESGGVLVFSDDLCKMPLGYTEYVTCDAETASAVGVLEPGACGQSLAYAEATKTMGPLFRSFANDCIAFPTPPASWLVYTPGALIPPSSFPTMATRLEGPGRLQVRRYATGAGKSIDSRPAFWDTTLKADCVPAQTPMGLRCMSSRAYGLTFYGDDKCTQPVHVESKTRSDPACAALRPDVLYREKGTRVCNAQPTFELFQVGGPVTVDGLYRLDGTSCTAAGFSTFDNDVFAATPATDATAPALQAFTE